MSAANSAVRSMGNRTRLWTSSRRPQGASLSLPGPAVSCGVRQALVVFCIAAAAWTARAADQSAVADRVQRLTRDSTWTRTGAVPIRFRTFHPQGLAKVGDTFFASAVEVRKAPAHYPAPVDGYDRDAGEGVGHLFKFDSAGRLIAETILGGGTTYHPGGIDYDGTWIWAPVSEYRPDSRAVIYKIDPATLRAVEAFRFEDHIGAIVHDTDARTLYGVSWGSRRFYRWTMDAAGVVTNVGVPPAQLRILNPSHYVDYQDCKYAGLSRMLCTGVSELRPPAATQPFRLGGLDLVSLADARPIHQVPVPVWTSSGLDMTHNPSWFEATATGLRAYFMPE